VPSTMKVAGLFAGIGGIELGFQRALGDAVETELLCEWWQPARKVLAARFDGIPIHPDVRELRDLPKDLDVLPQVSPAPTCRRPAAQPASPEPRPAWSRTSSRLCASPAARVTGCRGC